MPSCGTEISRELEDLELLLEPCPWLKLDRFAGFDLQRSLGQRINAGAGITTRYRESAKPNKLDSNSVFGRLVANFNGFTRFLNGGLDGGQYGAQRLLCFGLGCGTQIALKARPEVLRFVLAAIVIAVALRMLYGLGVQPDEIYTVSPL